MAPIYFLMGEEPYYIDGISDYIENHVLTEDEKSFNQMVLYGRDTSIDEIIGHAKRYPMMAEYQVVIVKEAQELSRTIENLLPYVENPQPSTILVVCYKYKKLDARKKLTKELRQKAVLFESNKLYENQVPDWIRRVLSGKGYQITPKSAQMLTEFLGNDLAKINNELEKLQLILKPVRKSPHNSSKKTLVLARTTIILSSRVPLAIKTSRRLLALHSILPTIQKTTLW